MTDKEIEQNMLMEFIADTCFIDIEKKIEYPPVCLSFGEKVLQSDKGDSIIPIALGTYGNLSVITAPPKTMKTFFVSLLASAYLSDNNRYRIWAPSNELVKALRSADQLCQNDVVFFRQ